VQVNPVVESGAPLAEQRHLIAEDAPTTPPDRAPNPVSHPRNRVQTAPIRGRHGDE
jgi:hypothetical protein